ncbi:unnamed protein product [Prorocentrum cordatum]|uniref:Uncharacterized protein n=1 Tax=Prorocentrum cordatum TaxID=2364126 RepID=A0ABN9X5H9_9DINO|nr:unnamed protein product [Polarella glacialis]
MTTRTMSHRRCRRSVAGVVAHLLHLGAIAATRSGIPRMWWSRCFASRTLQGYAQKDCPQRVVEVHSRANRIYSVGINACETSEQWPPSLSLLRKIWQAKLEPGVIGYSAKLSACEKCGQWQQSPALLSDVREATLEPSVTSYSAWISAWETGEQGQQALALLSECERWCWSPTSPASYRGAGISSGTRELSAPAAPRCVDDGGHAADVVSLSRFRA